MPVLLTLPLRFALPPDGALDVPTNARFVAAVDDDGSPPLRLSLSIDGRPVAGEQADEAGYSAFTPDEELPPGAAIEVRIQRGGDQETVTFATGDAPLGEPELYPEVGALHAERAGRSWAFAVDATPPAEAAPYGLFQVAWRDADGEEATVDESWPADGGGSGEWSDDGDGQYCAGIAYADVAGQYTTPVVTCADLPAPEVAAGCDVSGGRAAPGLLLALPLLLRRRR